MRTTFGPDHPCPACETAVYWWVGTRGETRLMEVDHCRPHTCVPIVPAPTRLHCPVCRTAVYLYQDELYDEDSALVRHQCPALAPTPPARTAPAPLPLPQVTVTRSIATTLVQIPRLADHE